MGRDRERQEGIIRIRPQIASSGPVRVAALVDDLAAARGDDVRIVADIGERRGASDAQVPDRIVERDGVSVLGKFHSLYRSSCHSQVGMTTGDVPVAVGGIGEGSKQCVLIDASILRELLREHGIGGRRRFDLHRTNQLLKGFFAATKLGRRVAAVEPEERGGPVEEREEDVRILSAASAVTGVATTVGAGFRSGEGRDGRA